MILYIPSVQERGKQNAGFIPWRSTNSKSRNFYKDYRSHLFIRLYSFKYLQGIAWVECLRERTHGLRTYNIDF